MKIKVFMASAVMLSACIHVTDTSAQQNNNYIEENSNDLVKKF